MQCNFAACGHQESNFRTKLADDVKNMKRDMNKLKGRSKSQHCQEEEKAIKEAESDESMSLHIPSSNQEHLAAV